jgi:serine protease Do
MTARFWLPIVLGLGKIAIVLILFFVILVAVVNAEETGRSEAIQNATEATVLIKTHLKHGFLEDDQATGRWEGSGFLFNREKGWILTNAHVAGFGPVGLRLKFEGQDKFSEAKRLFVDSKHDVAVLEIDPSVIPSESKPLELDCSYDLVRGDSVFSVGHPENQNFTASLGVLSGEKDFHVDGSYFTTDLVTEPGSSGGPVILEKSNKVVGMMTSGFTSSDLGFLTKAKDICRITGLLEAGKNPARPRFGFQTMIDGLELSPFVGAVFDSGLDLQTGDEIVSWDGNLWDPNTDGDLADAMRGYEESGVQLSILRDGTEVLVDVPVTISASYHKRDWVFVSGLLITQDGKSDAAYALGNTPNPVLIIESVDTDFDDTTDIELGRGSEILKVDDLEGVDLKTLYEYLEGLPADAEIEVVGRAYDWSPEAYTTLMRHTFRVEELGCSWCDR